MRSSTCAYASLVTSLFLVACEGPAGPQGPQGDPGSDGQPGSNGSTGSDGTPGSNGTGPWLTGSDVAIDVTSLTFVGSAATVAFAVTDGSGKPLDIMGNETAGTVAVSFELAQLAQNTDGSPGQYTSYTTEMTTSGSGVTATQVWAESNGTLDVVNVDAGTYTYTFASPLTGFDPALTQTVGALAVRTLNGTSAIGNDTFSVVPNGGTALAREVVTIGNCNACHKNLSMHGGRWTQTAQCILCHQPQNTDPTTGNTLDFKVMVHKIHDGSSLPSVQAGSAYAIYGHGGLSDFSTVVFPQAINNCNACHKGAAQGDRWETAPSQATCSSCHDNVWFGDPSAVPVGMIGHPGGEEPDSACTTCHNTTGLPIVPSMSAAHLTGLYAPDAPTLALAIESIANTQQGEYPLLTFTAQVSGAPYDLIAHPAVDGGSASVAITAAVAGPTTDIEGAWTIALAAARIGSGASVGEFTYQLSAADGAPKLYAGSNLGVAVGSAYGLGSAAIPAWAEGSYEVAFEGTLTVGSGAGLAAGKYYAVNPVLPFAVTDATVQPRRQIVDINNCQECHYSLNLHGGPRTNPQYCVFCHNPATYDTLAPRFEDTSNVAAEAIDFRHFLHKVHAGVNLTVTPYLLGTHTAPSASNPEGAPEDFSDVLYPAPLNDCASCHTGTTWQLPMNSSPAYAPTTFGFMSCDPAAGANGSAYCPDPYWTVTSTTQEQPTTSVCTSCHDAPYTLAHAQTNTAADGTEACATCHGPGMQWDVANFHGQP